MTTSSARIPEPRSLPFIRHLHHIDPNTPMQSMIALSTQHGPLFRVRFPGTSMLVLGSHALVNEVCDESRFRKAMHSVLLEARRIGGDGLFTAHDDEANWALAHRVLTPALGSLSLRNMYPAMLEVAVQLADRWERLGADERHDVADQMTRLTLDTIALCGFDFRFNSFYRQDQHSFVDAMMSALREVGERSRRHAIQNKLLFFRERRLDDDIARLQRVVEQVIRDRRAEPSAKYDDLLSRMLDSVDPVTGQRLSDENIRNQIVTFLIAGHETTSGLLSFALYELAKNPAVLAEAQREVDRVFGTDPHKLPSFEQVVQLEYVDQVLRESLRLWPTAPAFGMTPREDTTLAGRYPVAKGESMLVLLPLLHRDPEIWGDDAESFRPERFARPLRDALPVHAYKPFGTGARACIGRPFAMQEATLVLGMLLSRFELQPDPDYKLTVKETLTLKPDGFRLRVRPRQKRTVVGLSSPSAGAPAQASAAQHAQHATPLLVLFGSSGGTSEALARRLVEGAHQRGYRAQCAPLDRHAGNLPNVGAVLLICASYNGQPSHNARTFSDWLAQLSPGALHGVRYAVFGCGHRDWASTYQAVPRALDAQLAEASAERLSARGEGDAAKDLFGDFERWQAQVFVDLARAFTLQDDAEAGPARVEVSASPCPELARHVVQIAEVLESRELIHDAEHHGKSKRHLELRLPEGMHYGLGDYLRVLPRNAPDVAARAARALSLPLSGSVRIGAQEPVAVLTLLEEQLELTARATPRHVRLLADSARCPPERSELLALAEDGQLEQRFGAHGIALLELLERFPSARPPLSALLAMWPPLATRRYSISSSPALGPDRCTLTLSVLDVPSQSGTGRYRGTASTYLARLCPGDLVAVAVEPAASHFLPPAHEVPLIMLCAGSGIAPFRAFVQQRMFAQQQGAVFAPALLYFGCDRADRDYLYRAELEAAQAAGVVQLRPTFCAAPEGELVFVQHRLWREREEIQALLRAGAQLRVCGDARLFAPAVQETLTRIIAEAGLTPLEQLVSEGRYAADVFA